MNTKAQIPTKDQLIVASQMVKTICDEAYIPVDLMLSKDKSSRVAHMRFVAFSALYNGLGLTTIVIGNIFNRDYSTVVHGLKYVKRHNILKIRARIYTNQLRSLADKLSV
jgi:chromosomal replication initiation ATPase DnaA